MNYWKMMYGKKSNDFILGVIAGVKGFAVWKDGKQIVGIREKLLKDEIIAIKDGLGWEEEKEVK